MGERVTRENVARLVGILEQQLKVLMNRQKFLLTALVKMSKTLQLTPLKTWATYQEYLELSNEVRTLQETLKVLRKVLKK